jgi:small subunit ribosomal protein S16
MVKIRLMRRGATKRPFYRVVVADSRSPRDGRFIENIGKYHPLDDPSTIEIDEDRALYWLSEGAQPTSQVANLLRIRGIWDRFEESKGASGAKGSKGSGVGKAKPTKPATAEPAGASEPADAAEPATS